jgi:hypothetical protein
MSQTNLPTNIEVQKFIWNEEMLFEISFSSLNSVELLEIKFHRLFLFIPSLIASHWK